MSDTDRLPLPERLLAHSRVLGDEQDDDLRRDALPPHLRPVFDDLLLAAQALETRRQEVAHLHEAAARRNVQLDVLIDWARRQPEQVGALLLQFEAAVAALGPEGVAARVAEGKRFLGALPAAKAQELVDACVAARSSLT